MLRTHGKVLPIPGLPAPDIIVERQAEERGARGLGAAADAPPRGPRKVPGIGRLLSSFEFQSRLLEDDRCAVKSFGSASR